MDNTTQGYALAAALQAIAQCKADEKLRRKEYTERLERLQNEACQLQHDILTGQKGLFTPEDLELDDDVADDGPAPDYIAGPVVKAMAEKLDAEIMAEVCSAATLRREELIAQAIPFCRERGHVSIKELCDHFKGLYTAGAIHLIDIMDERGLLLPAEGSGPRRFKQEQTA